MPEQNEKRISPKLFRLRPKVKDPLRQEENAPKISADILNELVRSPLLAAVFDLQGQPAPSRRPMAAMQLPQETKISLLLMVTSPEGKRYYLGFSDWDAVCEWQSGPSRNPDHPAAL